MVSLGTLGIGCQSGASSSSKEKLKQILFTFDAHLKTVIPAMVLFALLAGCFILTMQFINDDILTKCPGEEEGVCGRLTWTNVLIQS